MTITGLSTVLVCPAFRALTMRYDCSETVMPGLMLFVVSGILTHSHVSQV